MPAGFSEGLGTAGPVASLRVAAHASSLAGGAECRTATVQIHVLRYGGTPFGLAYLPIQDDCVGRRADFALPLPWVPK